MFRLIRLIILILLAFAAGIWVGKSDLEGTCRINDGTLRDGLCFIEEIRK